MDTFDLKKFITEGRLMKETGRRNQNKGHEFIHKYLTDTGVDPTVSSTDELDIYELGGYEGFEEDRSKVFSVIKDVERAGGTLNLFLEPYDLDLTADGSTLIINVKGNDAVNEGQYADNTIEMDGHDIDLDSFKWEVYNKDRTDPELVYAAYTNGEELAPEHYDALNDMYFDDFNEWAWDYGTVSYK